MGAYISAIGTANPAYRVCQKDVCAFMQRASDLDDRAKERLNVLYEASGIEYRYSVLQDYTRGSEEFVFFPNNDQLEPFPTTRDRMRVYQEASLSLSKEAVGRCVGMIEGFDLTYCTHLITVSCTGMVAPGLDIMLAKELGLRKGISRTAINFMGCYAAVSGLRVANSIVRADPNAVVLLVCVELCTLHFQKGGDSSFLVSNALFGDGAAAVVVEGKQGRRQLGLDGFFSGMFSEGEEEMGWQIGNFGFEMLLTQKVPLVIKRHIASFMGHLPVTKDDIAFYALHPGGKKILEVIEEVLGLSKDANRYAYQVLNDYGNMSSPTILFVLELLWRSLSDKDAGKKILSMAFGPGISVESMLLSVCK